MKPELKIVYTPTNSQNAEFDVIRPLNLSYVESASKQELVIFTKEEYNKFIVKIVSNLRMYGTLETCDKFMLE